jgi:hypothetical protein
MKRYLLFVLFAALLQAANAQRSAQIITEKNFYAVTAVKGATEVLPLLPVAFKRTSSVADYPFTDQQIDSLKSALAAIYDQHPKEITAFVTKSIRPSNSYILFHSLSDKDLWMKCWELYFTGINYIVDQYGLGKEMRYPGIDRFRYKDREKYFQEVLKNMFVAIGGEVRSSKYFFESPLLVAVNLMAVNDRDEPARHEPLEKGENNLAVAVIHKTDFRSYPYSAIVVPGDGPMDYSIPLAPQSKMRCELAAKAYREKKAPVIIFTGGYCHPIQTEYSEAVEMKKYMMKEFGEEYNIPESAIIIDPHARHTTTNIRNAGRYIIGYGMPLDKPALLVSTSSQVDYIMKDGFDQRCMSELGYLPFKDKTRISESGISFYPVRTALHRDPTDPLDP